MSFYQKHHLIPGELFNGKFNELLKRNGITKTSAFNLLNVPAAPLIEEGVNIAGNVHHGSHLDSYVAVIAKRLEQINMLPAAAQGQQLDRLIATLRLAVANGDLKTNKVYYPNANSINAQFPLDDYAQRNLAEFDRLTKLIGDLRTGIIKNADILLEGYSDAILVRHARLADSKVSIEIVQALRARRPSPALVEPLSSGVKNIVLAVGASGVVIDAALKGLKAAGFVGDVVQIVDTYQQSEAAYARHDVAAANRAWVEYVGQLLGGIGGGAAGAIGGGGIGSFALGALGAYAGSEYLGARFGEWYAQDKARGGFFASVIDALAQSVRSAGETFASIDPLFVASLPAQIPVALVTIFAGGGSYVFRDSHGNAVLGISYDAANDQLAITSGGSTQTYDLNFGGVTNYIFEKIKDAVEKGREFFNLDAATSTIETFVGLARTRLGLVTTAPKLILLEGFLRVKSATPQENTPSDLPMITVIGIKGRKVYGYVKPDGEKVFFSNGYPVTASEVERVRVVGSQEYVNGQLVTDATVAIQEIGSGGNPANGLNPDLSVRAIPFAQFGSLLGANLSRLVEVDDPWAALGVGTTLGTLGLNIGQAFEYKIKIGEGASFRSAFKDAFEDIGIDLANAGIGAVSSYLLGELFTLVDLPAGFEGAATSLAGAAIGQIAFNLLNPSAPIFDSAGKVVVDGEGNQVARSWSTGININLFANAAGSFLGTFLASKLVQFDTIGGQIGASVGAAAVSIAAVAILGPVGLLANFAVPFVGAFLGYLLGGLIGSLFGGTPRSRADVVWDADQQQFEVGGVFARKGGSRQAARGLAEQAATLYNGVLSAVGGKLLDAQSVRAGSYGLYKRSYSYGAKYDVKFKTADTLINYGAYNALSDIVQRLAGGDLFVKRALASTLAQSNGAPTNDTDSATRFNVSNLSGNMQTALDYNSYLSNKKVIDALIAFEPESTFSAKWIITLARAIELGLDKRAYTDWIGGWNVFLDEINDGIIDGQVLTPTSLDVYLDSDTSERRFVTYDADGNFVLEVGDTIDAGEQTLIDGTAGNDNIDLSGGAVLLARGVSASGDAVLAAGGAQAGVDYTPLAISATPTIAFPSTSARRATVNIPVLADAMAEGPERFSVRLTGGDGLTIVSPERGGAGTVTISNGTAALPTLQVGRVFTGEGATPTASTTAIFRVTLSKPSSTSITVTVALAAGTATGGGVDFGSTTTNGAIGTNNLEAFINNAWTPINATNPTISFSAGQTEILLRTLIKGDSNSNTAEGDEQFALVATVDAANGAKVANGQGEVRGIATIIDSPESAGKIYAWVDDAVVDEASGNAAVTVVRSNVQSTPTSFNLVTEEIKTVQIPVAAVVDGGAGDDIIRASDLGDTLIGGAGKDTLYGGRLDDWLLGGDGNDTLNAGSDAPGSLGGNGNYLDGGAGDDVLIGREGSDWLKGGDGVDTLTGGDGGDILDAGPGSEGATSDTLVRGGGGSDQYVYNRGDGSDVYFDEVSSSATPGSTWGVAPGVINWAGGGDYSVDGSVKGGEDAIVFGPGITAQNIVLKRSDNGATAGNDLIIRITETVADANAPGGFRQQWNLSDQITVKDWFDGTRRIEWLRFSNGEDIRIGDLTTFFAGTAGADTIVGTSGNDFIAGGEGNDKLFGLAGDDWVSGGLGNDLVSGNDNADYVIGGNDDDVALGGDGNDVVSGDDGKDRVYGGVGNDIVTGGKGDDEVVGGAGDDVFRFNRGDGRDTLFDEFAGDWEAVWQGGSYAEGYVVDANGRVTKNGVVYSDGSRWFGNYDYNEHGGTKTLLRLVAPTSAPLAVNSGNDTLEFGAGIDIQNLVFKQDGNDLRIAITAPNGAIDVFSDTADQIRIKDWYSGTANVGRAIENFRFINTGSQAVSTMALLGGTDGDDNGLNSLTATTAEAYWITGGGGDDSITGGNLNDILSGNSGSDRVDGGDGADVLYGGDGDDTLIGGKGADILVGGDGSDTASYETAASGVIVYLDPTLNPAPNGALPVNTFDALGDTFFSIENLTGSAYNDTLYGDAGDNVLDGGLGSDNLYGGAGNDIYQIYGGMGADTVFNETQENSIEAGSGISLSNLVFGRINGNDLKINIVVAGQAGINNLIIKSFFDASSSVNQSWSLVLEDQLNFVFSYQSLIVAPSSVTTTGSDGDDFIVSASNGNFSETLKGGAGNDVLSGLAGNDTLEGGDGDDVLEGGAGADILNGGADLLTAGAAPSRDAGGDTIRYAASAVAVKVDLTGATAPSGGDANGDTIVFANGFSTIENIVGSNALVNSSGLALGDVLTGDDRANRLFGLAGDDSLYGNGGNDVLVGGAGADNIDGGAGDDNIDAGDGNDTASGGDGNDLIFGGDGNDTLNGDAGKDRINGGSGDDTLRGGADNDILGGDDGNDALFGDAGDDELSGGIGNDTLWGGDGADKLQGDAGNDSLNGGSGDDSYIFGANFGRDVLIDNAGTNRLLFASHRADQLWLIKNENDPQNQNDLIIGVLGSDDKVTVKDYFSTTNPTLVREIVTSSGSLFLKYAGELIRLMTEEYHGELPAANAPTPTSREIDALRAQLWWANGKAVPLATGKTLTFYEDTPQGDQLRAIDHDENITGYYLATQASHGSATVNADGSWTYIPYQDYSGADSFAIGVRDADNQTAIATYSLNIEPVNDAPIFEDADRHISVAENAENGTFVEQIFAYDPDGEHVTYTLLDALSPFEIDSTYGVLTVRDGSLLDYEQNPTRTLNVRITDGQGGSTDHRFTVDLLNVNEQPDTPLLLNTVLARINEGTSGIIASFILRDVDGLPAPRLRLKTGDPSLFYTNSANLVLRSSDFEALARVPGAVLVDRDNDGLKEVELTASVEAFDSDGLTSPAATAVTVGIEDVNEAPTDLTLSGPSTMAERDRPQAGDPLNAVSLGRLTTTDPDLPSEENFIYSVADSRFQVVNGNELQLKAGAAFDYESALADSNGRYVNVDVTVKDRNGSAISRSLTRTFRIAITDADDYLYGTPGNDQGTAALQGQAGRDIIDGSGGDDQINGNDGDDMLDGGDGNDTISGGSGRDKILGGSGNDTISGDNDDDELRGWGGDDTIYGNNGNDFISGDIGNDILNGGAGDDTIYGGEGNDNIAGAAGNDRLFGDSGNDLLNGGLGADALYGGDGDDVLNGGEDADVLDGGAGIDTANYEFAVAAVTANLGAPGQNSGEAAGDTYVSIEKLSGSAYGDTLVGDANNNVISGNDGDDIVNGGDGADTLRGGNGNDNLDGGAGNDLIYGDAGNDTLSGGDGLDTLYGGAGNDLLIGGAGADVYSFARGDGDDRIDQTGALASDGDLIGFTDGIMNKNLWFQWVGGDVKITVLGATGVDTSVTLLNYAGNGQTNVQSVIAQDNQLKTIRLAIGQLATIMDRFVPQPAARPTTQAQFDALFADSSTRVDGLTFSQQWSNFWTVNTPPTLTVTNAAGWNQGWQEDRYNNGYAINIRLSDDQTPAPSILVQAVEVADNGSRAAAPQLFSSIDVTRPVDNSGLGTIAVRTTANASGTRYIWVHLEDAGGLANDQWIPITVAPVADAPVISRADSPGGNSDGSAITLNITADVTDTDGSEVLDKVEISGVPAGFSFSNADGTVSASNSQGNGLWRFSRSQLAGLKLTAPANWSADLSGTRALQVTAYSRETANGATASTTAPLSVRINAPPTDIVLSGHVTENAAPGTVIGVASVVDPDRLEDNKINLNGWGNYQNLINSGWQFLSPPETQFINTQWFDGNYITALQTGQFDAEDAGGGAYSNTTKIDTDKAYKFTIFIKPENTNNHYIYFGISDTRPSFVEYSDSGIDRDNPYFLEWSPAQQQQNLVAGRWYRVEGYVLPRSSGLVAQNIFGGVFDAATNQKVGNTNTFRWNDSVPGDSLNVRFFNFYGTQNSGWSTDWYQPTIEELPAISGDDLGGKLAIDSRSGLITAGTTLIDYDILPANGKTLTTTLTSRDSGGLSFSKQSSIIVDNVNEAPTITSAIAAQYLTETGLGSRPASANSVVATIGVADPDGTTPNLEITSGNGNGWFYVDQASKQIKFSSGFNFDFEGFKAANYPTADYNADGVQEARIANITVRAFDGSLASATQSFAVYIQDVPEAPNVPQIITSQTVFSETVGGASSNQAGRTIATFALSDPDGPAPELRITGGNGNGWFELVNNELRFTSWPNFSADYIRANNGRYGANTTTNYDTNGNGLKETLVASVELKAVDTQLNYSGPIIVPVYIEDVNEAPINLAADRALSFNEGNYNGAGLAWFTASDPDGETLTYTLTNDAGGRFSIDSNGLLRGGATALDYETGATPQITVKATDPRGGSVSTNFAVTVKDVNEAPEITTGQSFSVAESAPGAGLTTIGTVSWSDPDTNPGFRNPQFTITGGNTYTDAAGRTSTVFSIGQTTGVITLQSTLNYETIRQYTPTIKITDAGGLGLSANQSVTINVTDVNEQPNVDIRNDTYSLNTSYVYFGVSDQDSVKPSSYTLTISNLNNGDTNHHASTPVWDADNQRFSFNITSDITIYDSPEFADYQGSYSLKASDQNNPITGVFDYKFTTRQQQVPIILDLDGDGVELTPLTISDVRFDMNSDGVLDRTGWVAADDGLLVLDRNGNGVIDNGSEIGFATDFAGATSDLQGLRAYDTNNNGYFDSRDDGYASFQIWQDRNQDGVSQADELSSLADHDIQAISLGLLETNIPVEGATDNVIFAYSEYVRNDGTSGDVGDVFLAYQPGAADPFAAASAQEADFAGDGASYGFGSASSLGGAYAFGGASRRSKPAPIRFTGLDPSEPLPDKLKRKVVAARPDASTVIEAAQGDKSLRPSGLSAALQPLQSPVQNDQIGLPQAARVDTIPVSDFNQKPETAATARTTPAEAQSSPSGQTGEDATVAPSSSIPVTRGATDPLEQAIRLLASTQDLSERLLAPTERFGRTAANRLGGTSGAPYQQLDQLINAMASFQSGGIPGAMMEAQLGRTDAMITQLAPSI